MPMLPDHIKKAIEEYIPPLGDWLDLHRACQMAELIYETDPKVVVEIGTFKGQSLLTMAFALRELNHGGTIYGIDPWKNEYALEGDRDWADKTWWKDIDLHAIHQGCMEQIWAHHLDEWVVVIRAPSQHVSQLFARLPIDVLYIDGNHSELASVRDVCLYVPHVAPGRGWIIMDDTDWQTTQKAVSLIDDVATFVPEMSGSNYKYWQKK